MVASSCRVAPLLPTPSLCSIGGLEWRLRLVPEAPPPPGTPVPDDIMLNAGEPIPKWMSVYMEAMNPERLPAAGLQVSSPWGAWRGSATGGVLQLCHSAAGKPLHAFTQASLPTDLRPSATHAGLLPAHAAEL